MYTVLLYAAVVELADTRDLKSLGSNIVPVQVRSAALNKMDCILIQSILFYVDHTVKKLPFSGSFSFYFTR